MADDLPQSVLITGGTGSFGKTMLRQLLDAGVPEIRVLSRDEEKQDALRAQLRKIQTACACAIISVTYVIGPRWNEPWRV